MAKSCEFCVRLRPVIYCKADAAHLCLSCDAKVHSANALANRHVRTLLCDSCKSRPTFIQCLNHQMYLCRNCDRKLHGFSSEHQQRAISSYMGCPSAKDFAALWGFKLNKADDFSGEPSVSMYSGSGNSSVINLDVPGQSCSQILAVDNRVHCSSLISSAEPAIESSGDKTKIFYNSQEQNIPVILQQLLEFKNVQLSEGNYRSPLIRGKEKDSICQNARSFDEILDQRLQDSRYLSTDLHQQRDNPLQELKDFPVPFSFSQLEHLQSSPAKSSELWSQNMQDLGICDEFICDDNFKMPDVDLTFENFEELFGGDQDPICGLLGDKNVSYSSMEKDISLDKSDDRYTRMEDTLVTSSDDVFHSASDSKATAPSNQVHNLPERSTTTRPIRPYSSLSFSISRFGVDSADSYH